MDTRTILAELHATLKTSRRPRIFAKEPPLTIAAGPQHKVTAYLQGQSAGAFIRQLYLITCYGVRTTRLSERNVRRSFSGPRSVRSLEEEHPACPVSLAGETRNL